MKTFIALLATSLLGASTKAEVSKPFRLTTANYQDYRAVLSPVTFVAIAKVKPQQEEKFKAIVASLAGTMRSQAGNIYYDLHQSLSDPTEFLFVEEWKDGKSMADHMDSAAVQELVSKAGLLFEPGFPKFMILKKN